VWRFGDGGRVWERTKGRWVKEERAAEEEEIVERVRVCSWVRKADAVWGDCVGMEEEWMGIVFVDPVDENEVRRWEDEMSGNSGDVFRLVGEDDK
jgi:hypothetical protein